MQTHQVGEIAIINRSGETIPAGSLARIDGRDATYASDWIVRKPDTDDQVNIVVVPEALPDGRRGTGLRLVHPRSIKHSIGPGGPVTGSYLGAAAGSWQAKAGSTLYVWTGDTDEAIVDMDREPPPAAADKITRFFGSLQPSDGIPSGAWTTLFASVGGAFLHDRSTCDGGILGMHVVLAVSYPYENPGPANWQVRVVNLTLGISTQPLTPDRNFSGILMDFLLKDSDVSAALKVNAGDELELQVHHDLGAAVPYATATTTVTLQLEAVEMPDLEVTGDGNIEGNP